MLLFRLFGGCDFAMLFAACFVLLRRPCYSVAPLVVSLRYSVVLLVASLSSHFGSPSPRCLVSYVLVVASGLVYACASTAFCGAIYCSLLIFVPSRLSLAFGVAEIVRAPVLFGVRVALRSSQVFVGSHVVCG